MRHGGVAWPRLASVLWLLVMALSEGGARERLLDGGSREERLLDAEWNGLGWGGLMVGDGSEARPADEMSAEPGEGRPRTVEGGF